MGDEIPYDVAGATKPKPPRLRGETVVREDPDGLIDALLADLFIHAGNCVRTFGDFHFAVDAGPAVEPVLRRLLYEPSYREFPWGRTRVWMVREQRAAPTSWEMIREMIVEQSGIPAEQAHAIDASTPDAADRYAALLREHLGWRTKGHDRLDVVLLALGDGGGVGGLCWPCNDAAGALCSPRVEDVGLTAAAINGARFVAVYAPGPTAARDLRRVEANLHKPRAEREAIPALALHPTGGELRWYIDHAACVPT